jgi:hypothetical protein
MLRKGIEGFGYAFMHAKAGKRRATCFGSLCKGMVAVGVVAALGVQADALAADSSPRPNIVIIFGDDADGHHVLLHPDGSRRARQAAAGDYFGAISR